MTLLVAIEGADGAGKATAAAALVRALGAAGLDAEVLAFPRYGATIGGHVLGDFLAGRLPREGSPKALAVLYALDRLESLAELRRAAARCDVLVFDRYIASNVAYQAAKVEEAAVPALADWIVALETGQFGLPAPDLSVYLATPAATARAQIAQKARRDYTERTYDEHEADAGLQARVRDRYAAMAAAGVLGRWLVVEPVADGTMRPPEAIADEIAAAVLALPR